MSDEGARDASGLEAAINDSMAAVWKRYVGRRPTDVNTSVSGSRVECVLGDVVEQFSETIELATDGDQTAVDQPLTTAGYRREAAAVIAKLTRRRVMAVISNRNEATDVATEVFILDAAARSPRRNAVQPLEREQLSRDRPTTA
jgi:uncharacterized protein YbcI